MTYNILKRLGHGSFGDVYLLRVENGDEYALKVVDTTKLVQVEDKSVDAEARLMMKLCHAHLVQCCAYFLCNKHLYLLTEFCRYGSLKNYLNNSSSLGEHVPEEKVLMWLSQLADVLRYLHASKVIHRDIKTDNIYLDDKQNCKLGDLGIAREMTHTAAVANTFIGTYLYMSPEIFKTSVYSSKTDIWSLGCCIHEVMTLSPTFKGDSLVQVMGKITRGKFPAMPDFYSPILRQLVGTILNVNPKKRPDATDVLYYVCQIKGQAYTPGPHRDIPKIEIDQMQVCKAVQDFENSPGGDDLQPFLNFPSQPDTNVVRRAPRPLPQPRPRSTVPKHSKHRAEKSKSYPNFQPNEANSSESLETSDTIPSYTTDLPQTKLKEKTEIDRATVGASIPNVDIHQPLNNSSNNKSLKNYSTSESESLVTLYTRAQKVKFSKRVNE
ncbi:serine/threonine-protein kinase nekl-2-like [Physella acuta]|uniref:serine/threonine-protein kinase nekl-2-like n=1 Tax=Physella acuta TaxID=109671 RepID=UPI0027DBDF09|nr:serine/threonine-protein kinase nekl-2-like [Physella acuta]XP_059167783.1 serine/threonine-protein kinase nekl-2-like [Physella acuta]